ncbi:DUF3606 domain-containing protein [Muricoccus radiodurans]|uniref:DUF3606 domain-containing protein n=1 Tax=Muricoccus radiodurans TaxID=2231721 RepID=UPI003CE80BF3
MADASLSALPRKDERIDLHDPVSVRRWANAFRLSELDLAVAVQTAGPKPSAVAYLLRREPQPDASTDTASGRS